MGRPYAGEVDLLAKTYSWACTQDVSRLSDAVDALRARPLVVVGSGGSLTAAALAADLHEAYARLPARFMTPLEFLCHPLPQAAGVLLLSASGSNPDVLAAARHAVETEYAPVVGMTARSDAALTTCLRDHRCSVALEFEGPARKDGFLATNSLLLTCTLLARAYGALLPDELPALRGRQVSGRSDSDDGPIVESLEGRQVATAAFDRPNLILLADRWCRAPAVDLESKWAETGLGGVVITDARNFAHGRHVGLARRREDSSVVGLMVAAPGAAGSEGPERSAILRTMRRLPLEVPTALLRSPLAAEAGALDLISRVIVLTGEVGRLRGIDPGRPAVPAFGRKLYHDRVPKDLTSELGTRSMVDRWIRRKVTPQVWSAASEVVRQSWREKAAAWRRGVERVGIRGVVIDYDGTLCEADERCSGPSAAIASALTTLLDGGMVLGIATGRGQGVRDGLRRVLNESLWPRILVGMYNGGVLAPLSEETATSDEPSEILLAARETLSASVVISQIATLRLSPAQLTVLPGRPLPGGLLERFVREALLAGDSPPELAVLGSDHSVDVLPRAASKLRVVRAVQGLIAGRGEYEVMTLGDQGQAGGNDCDLLARPLGVSVDRVSSRFDSCWNVAAPGARRTAALLGSLAALEPRRGGGFGWSPERAYRHSASRTSRTPEGD